MIYDAWIFSQISAWLTMINQVWRLGSHFGSLKHEIQ